MASIPVSNAANSRRTLVSSSAGRPAFLERLDIFEGAIERRENALLDFLAEPHSIDEVAEHRFVYRPSDDLQHVEMVERRSMQMHIDRLIRQKIILEEPDGRYCAKR